MKRALLAAALLVLVLAAPVSAGYGADDEYLKKLYTTFVAPCCWRDNLDIHDSPRAAELRARIRDMVEAGQSDDQIKAALVAEYGQRILVVPEGATRVWLFRTPWLLAAIGLLIVFLVLRRMRHLQPIEDA